MCVCVCVCVCVLAARLLCECVVEFILRANIDSVKTCCTTDLHPLNKNKMMFSVDVGGV